MNEKRKQLILSEIEYWKQHNLLPEHYCDFLSTLYGGVDPTEEVEVKVEAAILHKEKRSHKWMMASVGILGLILAIVMQFIHDGTAILIGAVGVVALLSYATIKSVRRTAVLSFIYIVSAFLLLIMSLKLWSLYFGEQPMLLIALLILNCIMWLFAGRLLKLLYFTLSGAIGLASIVIFLVTQF